MNRLYRSRLVVFLLFLLVLTGTAGVHADSNRNFVAHLSGSEEVPTNASLGQGQAFFQLSPDGSELHYQPMDRSLPFCLPMVSLAAVGSMACWRRGPLPPPIWSALWRGTR
jgi:hypothetical protein